MQCSKSAGEPGFSGWRQWFFVRLRVMRARCCGCLRLECAPGFRVCLQIAARLHETLSRKSLFEKLFIFIYCRRRAVLPRGRFPE
jgi:hypothetical protein